MSRHFSPKKKSHLSKPFVQQGNTAVYLLYAHARICSIIEKSGKDIEELKKVSFSNFHDDDIGFVEKSNLIPFCIICLIYMNCV